MLPPGWANQHRDVIWPRAVEEFLTGIDWDRCDEAERQLSAERNEDFTEIDPWTEAIEEILSSRQQLGNLPVKNPELLDGVGVPKDRQDARGAKRVRQNAVALGWVVAQRRHRGKRLKGVMASCCPPWQHLWHPRQHLGVATKTLFQTGELTPWQHRQHQNKKLVEQSGGGKVWGQHKRPPTQRLFAKVFCARRCCQCCHPSGGQ